jgi:pantoate--beta-alanine ligase
MKTFQEIISLQTEIEAARKEGKRIGFVPTMGALHQGHLSLIAESKANSDITVCSIFVNPLQFNNPDDFEKYPVVPRKDIELLAKSNCELLFMPGVKEMYPEKVSEKYDFGELEKVMEGAFRPGHFNGVGIVVKRLFDIVKPDLAFFGEKDYQQLLIIRKLVEIHHLDVQIVACKIIREADGLAMSSRNMRLSQEQRSVAPFIYKTISKAVSEWRQYSPDGLKEWVSKEFAGNDQFKLDYFELSDANNLQPVKQWKSGQECIACIAVYMGEIRLIDNIRFIS